MTSVVVIAQNLRLRAAPSLDSFAPVILPRGTRAELLALDPPGWAQLRVQGDEQPKTGWCMRRMLDMSLQAPMPGFPSAEARMWDLAQYYTGRVWYQLGAKAGSLNDKPASIDCSGWVAFLLTAAMRAQNVDAQEDVFDEMDISACDAWADRIILEIEARTPLLVEGTSITADSLPACATIGLDLGAFEWERNAPRLRGINHIAQLLRRPEDGARFVSESRGPAGPHGGVRLTSLTDWLAENSASIAASKAWAVDPWAMADPFSNWVAQARNAVAPASAGPGATAAPPPALAAADTPATLRAIQLGDRGDLVRAWQSFLAGRRFDLGEMDGYFGDKTVEATQAFQRDQGLEPDGVAGRQTIMKAMQLGFELVEEPASDTSGSNFPPRPSFSPLVTAAERQAIFGKFDFVPDPRPDNPENIRILGTWEMDNIVAVPIPQLRKALGPGAPESMRFHRLAAAQLQALWSDWEQANLLDRVLSFGGSFVPRFIRGSTTVLSNHAFGSAFDINAQENPLGARPALVGEPGSTRELVPLAHKNGFYWGGHFGTRLDGMHFEIALIQG